MARKTSPKRRFRKTSPKRRGRPRKTSPKRRVRKPSSKRRMNPGSEPQWVEYHHHQGHGPSSLTHPHGRVFDDDKKIRVKFHMQSNPNYGVDEEGEPIFTGPHGPHGDPYHVIGFAGERNVLYRDHQKKLPSRHTIGGTPTQDDQEIFIRSLREKLPLYGKEGTHLLAEALEDSRGLPWGAKIFGTRETERDPPSLEYQSRGSTMRREIK